MMTRLRNIGLLILLLLAGQMAAQVPVLDSVCSGAVRHYGVYGEDGSTYSWIITPPAGPVVLLPSDADTVEVTWAYPADTYILQAVQHSLNGCDADAVYGQVVIVEQADVYAGPDALVCVGRYYKLVNATADYTSSLLWVTSGDGTFDDNTLLVATYTPGANDILAGTVTLTLTGQGLLADGGCEPSVSTIVLTIVYEIVPTFESIGPLCQYSVAPALPDTSLEGMTGNWTPPVISTLVLGNFPFTFSPDDPAQCGVDTTIWITITDQIAPLFDQIGPLCINSTAPPLPGTSLNGITGTWDPSIIDTSIPGTVTYYFTPNDPTQCGIDTTMDITIVLEIVPEFAPIGPLCQYSTPPALPGTSLNGISGTWEPPVPNTDEPGTFYFTFTPYPDQCGTDTTIEITILEQVAPLFEPIGPLCQYSAAPDLPGISLNGITGTWNPAWINTTTPGIFTFTFTPDDPTQCGRDTTMDIIIIPEIAPTFEPIGPLCQFSTPPLLPDTCLQGIPGTWEPPNISTVTTGTFFFIFTPDPAYPCVLEASISITVVSEIVPEFDPIGPLCQNTVPPLLPGTSNNGITGTWDPPFIITTVTGEFEFTFMPDPGQCAVDTTIEIEITDEIIPEFDPFDDPICQHSVPPDLPLTSGNGITGTWTPPSIDTSVPGTITFTFTPDNPSQCGVEVTMDITVVPEIIPEFTQIGPLCQNSEPPDLEDVSNNGIQGSWDPLNINTANVGTFTYTFTPDDAAELCADTVTMDITIVTEITPVFDPIGPLCQDSPAPTLPLSSNNVPAITGTWDPDVIDTSVPGTVDYTFTPDEDQCGVIFIMPIEIIGTPQVTGLLTEAPHCGRPDGQLTILANSSSGSTLEYSIDGGSSYFASNVFASLPAGVYNVMVRDVNGCEVTYAGNPVVLNDVPGPLVSQTIVTDETDGLGNGSIEIIATGSMPLYYSINGGAIWQTNNGLFTSLSAGSYLCVVKDANDCDTSFTIVIDNIVNTILHAITIPGGHCIGSTAIVPLQVDHFAEVAKFQLKLSYNVDYLLCEGYLNVNPLLVDHLTVINDIPNGEITLKWQDTSPLTFITITTICDLVFTPKQAGLGQLDWYTGATESYFADLAGNPISADFFTGPFMIYDPPEILLKESLNACEADTVSIPGIASSSYPPLTYQWTYPDGQIHLDDPFFAGVSQADAGDYTLLVTDSLGCTDQKTIRLVVSANPVADFHDSDTLVVSAGYNLEAGSGMASYHWNTGEITESIRIDTTGLYIVYMVTHVGCVGSDSVFVIITEKPPECLFIPNAFTPDNDGLNDSFKAVSVCPLVFFRMEIYNRWGEMLFSSEDINFGWDGKKNGSTCPGDAYVYKIVYQTGNTMVAEKMPVKTGVVLILK